MIYALVASSYQGTARNSRFVPFTSESLQHLAFPRLPRWPSGVVAFLRELIPLEHRMWRGYGEGQA